MPEQFERTRMLFGDYNMQKLFKAKVAVFGIGGVGGAAAEALARAGIGFLSFIDKDIVDITNINRQIIATHKTIGRYKAEVMRERALEINPDISVTVHNLFYLPETADAFNLSDYDYIIDAVDTVTAKLELITRAFECKTPIISSMGAGNKTEPSQFRVSDIYNTSVCPLARVMRRELKKRGIPKLKVVYSAQPPFCAQLENLPGLKKPPASCSFVPPAAGLIMAAEAVKDLINTNPKEEL